MHAGSQRLHKFRRWFGVRAWAVGAALALLGSTSGAPAQQQGLAEASRYKGWTVSALRIEGLDANLARPLKQGLALAGQSRLLGTKRAVLFTKTVQEDLERAALFLARHGYPYARIEPAFDPAKKGRKVAVTLEIEPGRPVLVRSATLTGVPPELADKTRAALTLRKGAVLQDGKVEESVQQIERALKSAGYPRAQVAVRLARRDSFGVDLELAAQPGRQRRFGDVLVAGAPDDLVPLVRKTVAAKPGALYSPAVMDRANENLRGLGLFRQVRLSLQDVEPDIVDIQADLSPRKPRATEIGLGYWTDDYVRATARWQHRNFLRAGRGLEIRAAASRFRQEAGLSLWWPALFGARTAATTRLNVTHEDEESYELMNTQLELAATYRFSLATSVRTGVALSNVNVTVKTDDPGAFMEQGGLLTILFLQWSRDSSDDRLYPTRGMVSWLKTEWAPNGFLSENHFVSIETSGAWYRQILPNTVIATRLNVGLAEPTGESEDLLPNKRFYAGGPSSMRGAGRRKLGPLDSDGAPLGGRTKVLASAELRFPLYRLLRGALFVDTGQVWRKPELAVWSDVEVAVGPGLMFRTPVGPIRADVGYNLTGRPAGEPRTLFNLSVGHPF